MGNDILTWFLGLLGTVFTAVFTTILIPAVVQWLKAKTDNQVWHTVVNDIEQTVTTSVGYIQQTFVDKLKADGKFDVDAQRVALSTTLNEVKKNLDTATKKILEKDLVDIDKMIVRYIEAEINKKG